MVDEYDSWTGHRVRVRAVTPDDFDAFFADGRDKEAERLNNEVMPPQSPLHLEQRLKQVPDDKDDNCWLAIETRAGELVGSVNAHGTNRRHRHFYYGISVFRESLYTRGAYHEELIYGMLASEFDELETTLPPLPPFPAV